MPTPGHHRLTGVLTLLLAAALLSPLTISHAQAPAAPDTTDPPLLLLRPDCKNLDDIDPAQTLVAFIKDGTPGCKNYDVLDPFTQQTAPTADGEKFAMQIVLFNPTNKPIKRVRTWLSYDPDALEGATVTVSPEFPEVTPGESGFDASKGLAMIGASAAEGEGAQPSDRLIVIARVEFTVKKIPVGGSPVSFDDVRDDDSGHTFVTTVADPAKNILPPLGVLLVRGDETEQQTATSDAGAAASASSEAHEAAPETQTDFTLLQPQNLRVTTEGTAIYLAWDPLGASDLLGYEVFYGTEKGRYMQRHSVDASQHSAAIRGLVTGTTYYLAIRGVNGANLESAFSQEASVTVGEPRSSTSPLSIQSVDRGNPPSHPLGADLTGGDVPGASGSPSWTLMLLALAGVCGVMFSLRRVL